MQSNVHQQSVWNVWKHIPHDLKSLSQRKDMCQKGSTLSTQWSMQIGVQEVLKLIQSVMSGTGRKVPDMVKSQTAPVRSVPRATVHSGEKQASHLLWAAATAPIFCRDASSGFCRRICQMAEETRPILFWQLNISRLVRSGSTWSAMSRGGAVGSILL